MSQAVLRPNLTKKFQWEVSQIANKERSRALLQGGLSVNLNHLKTKYSNCVVVPNCYTEARPCY